MAILSAASKFGRSTTVRSTVVWYPGRGEAAIDTAAASAWSPIHTEFSAGNGRTVHGIWNIGGAGYGLPAFWYGGGIAWRGIGVPDMPHTPEQISRALTPVGLAAGDEETAHAAAAVETPASIVQIVVAVYNVVKKIIEIGRTLILVWKGGKWVVARLGQGVSKRPDVVYSSDYKRLFYLQSDGSYKMGNVIMD